MKKSTLAYVAILVVTVLWASSLILAKIVYVEMTPIVFVTLRYTTAVPFLVLFVLTSRNRSENFKKTKINWRIILIAGITGPFLSQVLQYIGLGMTTAGETLLLKHIHPLPRLQRNAIRPCQPCRNKPNPTLLSTKPHPINLLILLSYPLPTARKGTHPQSPGIILF